MTLKWSENYKRSYRITVGTRETTIAKWTVDAAIVVKEKVTENDYLNKPSNARILSNLAEDNASQRGFTFKLDAKHKATSKGSKGEVSTLDLFGLDEDLIKVINQDECIVIVEAGYQGQVEVAYTGDVKRVTSFRQGADMVHRLHCASGATDMRSTHARLSYDEEMPYNDIIEDMFGRMPNTTLGILGLKHLKDRKKTGGRHFNGKLCSSLERIAEENNLYWSHFNGKIVVIPLRLQDEDYELFSATNYTLDINSIKQITDTSDRKNFAASDTKPKLKKLQINTYYLPVDIGQFVTIPASKYTKETQGTYQVKGRRCVLESQGTAWDVVLELDELENS